MCVLPPLIPVSCTRWANIERPIFRRFRPWLVAGWVEDMSKLCLAAALVAIYGHNNSLLRCQMISRCACLEQAYKSSFQALIRDLFLCQQHLHHCGFEGHLDRRTEDRKDLGSTYTGSFRTTIGQYVTTERVLSPGR